MRHFKIPGMAFQKQSQLGEDCWHSVLISLLRGLAAVQVAAAHLRAAMYPGLRTIEDPSLLFKAFAFASGFAHQAVLVFFVISGWLVGGSLLNKIGQPDALANYAIDRVTRLWTVLIPVFLLILLFGLGTGVLSMQGLDFSSANEYSVTTFAGNLVGLQRVFLLDFGGNFPLWSLANETWYYLMFPLLVALFGTRRRSTRISCALALAVLAAVLPHTILLYFSIWMIGVAFSRIRIDCGKGLRLGCLALLVTLMAYFRLTGNNDDFSIHTLGPDLICSLLLAAFLSSLQFKPAPDALLVRPLARIGDFFANFSFSLYVLHIPLIGLLQYWSLRHAGLRQLSPLVPGHYAIYGAMLAFLLLASYASYLLFESQTYRVRRLVKQLLVNRASPHPGTCAVPLAEPASQATREARDKPGL